jgi:hypothetical protein
MSRPQPERHSNDAPYTDPALYEQQTNDGERVRPTPEPEKPATPKADPRITRQLTWDQIMYIVHHDLDQFFEEDFYRHLEFERAIEIEPEIE